MSDLIYWALHQFSVEGFVGYREWYASLVKPFFAPPAWAFGTAWGIIYPLIVLAFLWCLYLAIKKRVSWSTIGLFVLNIFFNLLFSPVLLATKSNVYAAIVIVLVLGTLVALVARVRKQSKVVAVLLLPYLAWVAFATLLQLSLVVLN